MRIRRAVGRPRRIRVEGSTSVAGNSAVVQQAVANPRVDVFGGHSTEIRFGRIESGRGIRTFPLTSHPLARFEIHPQRKTSPASAEEWVSRNIGKVQQRAGKWVAVHQTGIVATADSFDEVRRKAKRQGVTDPLVFKVPKPTAERKNVSTRMQ